MQRHRKPASIRALAILAVAGIVSFTAACGGSGGAKTMTGPYHSSGSTDGSSADGAGLGLYDGNSSPSGIETAAKWLGSSSSIKYAMDFIDATDWAHISDPWQLSNWKGSPFTMIWGVPMVPCGGPSTQCQTNVADYNLVASGGADGYYKTLAKNLVSAGFGSSYIRIGWEFNASSMGWSVCNENGDGPTSWLNDFVPAFRNIVTSMRSVSGASFKFIWNPIDSAISSCPGVRLENLYPGDSYVDAVALDVYDAIARMMPYAKGVSAKSYDFDATGRESNLDFTRILKIVTDSGYHGHVGIEYEGSKLSEHDGIIATKKLLESLRGATYSG